MNSTSPSSSPKNDATSSFGELLEKWESQTQEQESVASKGVLIDGTVVDVIGDTVFLDIGEKLEARVPREDFSETPKRGEKVSAVLKRRVDGYCVLSKKEADQRVGWETIKDAFANGYPLSGKIVNEVKNKGYLVESEGIQLFLPASHVGVRFKEATESGKEFQFKIIELNEKTKTGVVSRKTLLDEINGEKWEELLQKVKVGDKVQGKVVKIANFGVFLSVYEVVGLLRQNDISYKKFAPFKQYFQIGAEVNVVVLEVDRDNNKLSLGIKQLYEDPWAWAKKELEKGMVVRGLVTSLTNFGAFVELKEGLEGLIHTTELSWSKKPPHPKDVLKKGQEVDSEILDIDFEARRLSLGLKQLLPNPWESLSASVRAGSELEGKITGITKYGAFVEVESGIEGLIHISDITWDEKEKNPLALLKKGQSVRYKILDVNLDAQRISCGLKQLQEHPYEALRKKYPPGTLVEGKVKSIVSFGVFVEVEPGYEGLVHISEIPDGRNIKLEDLYKVGDQVRTVVVKIEPNNKKISLSIKDFDKAVEREEMAKYMKEDNQPSRESIGSFVNLNNNR
ncbi:30S ribosomal protein S1 [Leptospira ryugenii]|uniref:30S ribosomal protein S1 n=1 Tax=Leptospira ryugenii TaxID=1917863 RepID=A0A2P2E1D6_9LEPT|nr:30S ribosomal protein S1 [Leptospira ryugenii]GBF50708.1 30S ribosomal protein S1 [Leptospira ryugenii]